MLVYPELVAAGEEKSGSILDAPDNILPVGLLARVNIQNVSLFSPQPLKPHGNPPLLPAGVR